MKTTRTTLFRTIVLLAIALSAGSNAFAQATRTWASGVGDDANPCSRTAPCKTFAGAISKTAAGGEINAIDPGGFGAVTITKSMTIDGAGTMASIVSAGTNGIVINVGAADVVTIRNVSINGVGSGVSGIRMISGGTLVLENVMISGHTARGIEFIPAASATLTVKDVNIRNNGGGVLIKPGVGGNVMAKFTNSLLARNTSYGLRAEDNSVVVVNDSVAAGNTNNGFLAISGGGPVQLTLNRSEASGQHNPGFNSAGIQSNGGQSVVRISQTTVTGNDIGLYLVSGGSIASWGNNSVSGNNTNGAPNSSLSLQ